MSIKKCCVPHCEKSRTGNNILHLFPNPDKDFDRFQTWLNVIGGHILSIEPHTVFALRRVCHVHFETQYQTRSKRLSPNAVPTLLLSGSSVSPGPLQDITCRPPNKLEESQSNFDLKIDSQLSTFAQNPQNFLQLSKVVLPTPSKLVKLFPSSSIEDSSKRAIKCHSSKTIALEDKIKLLQTAKDTAVVKLKNALNLSKNLTFQETLKKLTPVARTFIMLQFREAGKKNEGRKFKEEERLLALAMYKQGPRAYRWLKKFFVLPSTLTLSKMTLSGSPKRGLNRNSYEELCK